MLARKSRLTSKREIEKTFKGKSARGSFFNIRSIRNKSGKTRVAIIVGKRVSPKSTERNLVKRRTSEAIKDQLGTIQGLDVVISALPNAKNGSFLAIKKEVEILFNNIGRQEKIK